MFSRMKISAKLAFGFSVITILLIGVSVFSIVELKQVNQGCFDIGTNWMPSIGNASELNTNTADYRLTTAEHLLTTDANRMQRREEFLAETEKDAAKNRGEYIVSSPEEKKIIDEFDSLWAQYKDLTAKMIALSKAGKKDEAQVIYEGDARAIYQKMGDVQDNLVDLNIGAGKKTYEDSDATYKSASFLLTGIGIGGTILSIFMAIVIARGITRPITHCTESLTQGALQVNQASGQVSQSSQTLASGASEQASSLEETSASLEELSSMTRQNADNSRQANALCTEASGSAERGSAAMKRMNDAINEIKSSADQTAKILKTIDEIAFQTNLLALNAAVEAARAGDAGKGFAVVAEEVRNLAQRSAEAAKNTAALIETGRKNADNGVAVAQDVAQNLDAIGNSIRKVTQLVSEVASASEEQDRGVGQINTAVSNMDKTTQSNAATAEEAASASEELTAQAASLNDIVGTLNALVYGAEKAAQLRTQPQHVSSAVHAKSALKRPDMNMQQALDTSRRHGSVKMAARPAPAAKKASAAASQRPQDVIPLSDDDMKDF